MTSKKIFYEYDVMDVNREKNCGVLRTLAKKHEKNN